jgi:hypothetical protein
MLHEVLAILMKYLKKTGATNVQGKAWDLVAKWCIMEAQEDAQGDSFMLFTFEAVTEGPSKQRGSIGGRVCSVCWLCLLLFLPPLFAQATFRRLVYAPCHMMLAPMLS